MHKVIQKSNQILLILPVVALFIMVATFVFIHAKNSVMNSLAVSDSSDYTVTLADDTTISVGFLGDPLVLNLQPTASGTFTSGDLRVEVATNSYYGYNLSMSATTTSLSGSVAVGSEKPTIPTLTSAVPEENFPNNFWGFKRGADTNNPDTNYQPMRANQSIPLNLVGDDGNSNSDVSTVTFGVKLDNATPSGTYDITINFLAIANINTPYYMQNITDAELANLMPSVNDTYTLTDSRDNKQYTVAKLKDGQYWMTTNLDLAGGTTITPTDSDVASNYTLPASSRTGFDDNSKAFVFNSNSTDCSDTDGCYSYYSWNAATAMSGTSITTTNTDASSSICPAGWHLPTSRFTDAFDMTTAYESDFYILATNYGMNIGGYSQLTGSAFATQTGVETVPNFVKAGIILHDGTTSYNNVIGYYWSATSYGNNANAYGLNYDDNYIYSGNLNSLENGFAVRCIHNATMQNLTDTEVAAMSTNEAKVLYDSRDNQRYTATKLADGKLWMTKNLNLAGGTTLTSNDTDMPAGYTLPTANGFESSNKLPASSQTGFSDSSTAYVYNSPSTDCSSATGCYSYYSWTAATLGSGASISTDNTDAPYSICPKGWRLPTSRSTLALAQGTPGSDFYKMAINYGLNSADINESSDSAPTFDSLAGPNTIPNFLRAGYYYNTAFNAGGLGGHYWSSSISGSATSYDMSFNNGAMYSATTHNRSKYGFAVRCLYDSSMQDFTATDASALPEGSALTLTDSRDGKTYTVKKINDRVWMTQNLAFTGTKLTPADSNVTSDTTMTYYSLASGDSTYANHCDSTNGYNYACIKDSGSTETGVWYNFAAASAGTITGNRNYTSAASDVCPSSWHLPTGAAFTEGTDFYGLFQRTESFTWVPANSYLVAFNPVGSNRYENGNLLEYGRGDWWGANGNNNGDTRFGLYYRNSDGQYYGSSSDRTSGISIRCIYGNS